MGVIPCSVNILTRNSASTLVAALESVTSFAEIIVGDGGSTDETRAIASRYGCLVVDQDPRLTDPSGRLVDYAGARAQLLDLSSHDWVLYLDSDEVLTEEAADAIAAAVSAPEAGGVGAYRLRAKHVVNGVAIEDGSKAGMREPRLLRRSAIEGFDGFVDEGPVLAPGLTTDDLDVAFLKPLPPVRALIPKWLRYLRVFAVEAQQKGPEWTSRQLPGRRSSIRWLLRGWRGARRRGHPNRMPARYEAAQVALAAGIYLTLWLVRLSQRVRRRT